MAQGPIFIGGLAYSGKTLMRMMVSSHPNIALTRRTYMWTRFYNRYGDLSDRDNFERCLSAMMNHKHIQVLEPDTERIRQEFWQGAPTYASLFALFGQHYAERHGKSRWGDQLGFVERYAAPIFSAYPNAKMIHMIRDPRTRYQAAVQLSRQRKGKIGWEIARWLNSVSLAQKNRERYSDRYKVVRYETLMAHPEETIREICNFIEEDFVPSMLTMEDAMRFGSNSDVVGEHAHGHITVTDSNSRSHTMLSQRDIAFTQLYAGPVMQTCDYELIPLRMSLRDQLLFISVDWPANRASMVAWNTLRSGM